MGAAMTKGEMEDTVLGWQEPLVYQWPYIKQGDLRRTIAESPHRHRCCSKRVSVCCIACSWT
jgi:hypothetical protein